MLKSFAVAKQVVLSLSAESDTWQPSAPPELSQHDVVILDTETTGLRWYAGDRPIGIAVHTETGSNYLPFGHRGGGNLSEAQVKDWAQRELRNKLIIGHTTHFDMNMLRAWGVDLVEQGCEFQDVSHAAALLDDHRRKFSLDTLAKDELGERKLASSPKDSLADLPSCAVAQYAMRDAELTARLAKHYAPLLVAQDLQRVHTLECETIPVTAEMMWNGVHVNEELLHKWEWQCLKTLEAESLYIAQLAGFSVSPDSNEDWKKLFQFYKLPLPDERTEGGKVSFTAAALQSIDHLVVQRVYRLGKLKDIYAKFLSPYLKHVVNGKIHCSLNQLRSDSGGTVSGRYSSWSPNMQQVLAGDKQKTLYPNVPYIIRQLFVPPAGRLWVSADQSQVEFRLAAHYANAKRLLQAYRDDSKTDFHKVVIDMIKPYRPEITRTEAKISSFLRVYGGGVGKLAETLGIDYSSAKQLSQQYDKAFPELKHLVKRAATAAETRGYVKTILGRRARFPDKQRTYSALNRVIQGSAADTFKAALVAVYAERKRLGFTLRLCVHDEVVVDVDANGYTKPVTELLELLNEQRIAFKVPVLWEAKVGHNWSETK